MKKEVTILTPEVRARFVAKIDKLGPKHPILKTRCWLWTAAVRGTRPYGAFKLHGRMYKAPRISWALFCGLIPDGLWVLHRCDNPRCVRPKHLFLGTARDNARDRDAKSRGFHLGNAVLTEEVIGRIRKQLSQKVSQRVIGEHFGVTQQMISRIHRGKAWRTA